MEERRRVLIERYLGGLMTPSERKEFQKQVKQNPSLARQLAAHKKSLSSTTNVRSNNGLPGKKKSANPKGTSVHFTRKRLWIYAAVIVLLIGIIWLLYYAFKKPAQEAIPDTSGSTPTQTQSPTGGNETTPVQNQKTETTRPTNDQLFTANFDPFIDESIDVTFRPNEAGLTPFQKFQSHYSFAEFNEAVTAYRNLSASEKQTDKAQFMYANALMATGKINDAIPFLQKVINNNSSPYKTEAGFYLALAHIKNNAPDAAIKLIDAFLTDPKGIQKEKANRLAQQLRMPEK